jgi:phosphatidylglycerol:prolipoprotein diacylglycerol transferase
MHPELLFSVFGVSYTVRSYDAFAVLAMISVLLLAPPLLWRAGLKTFKGLLFTVILLAVFLAGARLLNRAVNPLQYGDLLPVWSGSFTGFSLYGGLMAGGFLLPVLSYAFRCRLWAAADALVLPAGVAFALARIGCFLNGCCMGKATDSVLGITFPVTESETELLGRLLWFVDGPEVVSVWPVQLFELTLALLGLAIVMPLSRKLRLAEGSAALMYAMWFSTARWAVLPLRSLPYSQFITDLFYPMLYCAIIVACGWMLYCRNNKRTFRPTLFQK